MESSRSLIPCDYGYGVSGRWSFPHFSSVRHRAACRCSKYLCCFGRCTPPRCEKSPETEKRHRKRGDWERTYTYAPKLQLFSTAVTTSVPWGGTFLGSFNSKRWLKYKVHMVTVSRGQLRSKSESELTMLGALTHHNWS
ncbi:hypothetical protein K440DRAFT_618387 [Wilcoxina mikolae CBS 423.85]|nr:hypothetical protein K440DRAFT_618387 [Wilcoxina mikolae CBS 423.85]